MTRSLWEKKFGPMLQRKMAERGTPILHYRNQRGKVTAHFSLEEQMKRVPVDRHGNTSAASIPLAFDEAVQDGRIQRNQNILLEGFGGGFTWGSVLLTF